MSRVPKGKLHIVHGDKEADCKWLRRAAHTKQEGPWLVPKSVEYGDEVVIYVGATLFATARVISDPWKRMDRLNRYNAQIDSIRLIDPPISLESLRKNVPELKWTKYPRSITTVKTHRT